MTRPASTVILSIWLLGLTGCGDPRGADPRGWDLVIAGGPSGDTLVIDRHPETGEIDGFILSTSPTGGLDALVVPCGADECTVLSGRLLCAAGTWHACVDLDSAVACGATTFVCSDSYDWESGAPEEAGITPVSY